MAIIDGRAKFLRVEIFSQKAIQSKTSPIAKQGIYRLDITQKASNMFLAKESKTLPDWTTPGRGYGQGGTFCRSNRYELLQILSPPPCSLVQQNKWNRCKQPQGWMMAIYFNRETSGGYLLPLFNDHLCSSPTREDLRAAKVGHKWRYIPLLFLLVLPFFVIQAFFAIL